MNDSSNSPASPGRRRKRSRVPLIAGVVVVLAAGGWYGLHLYRAKQAAQGEYIFGIVQKGDIEDLVTSTGTLQPRDYVDVGAQVTGQIEKLYVEVGDEVKVGDQLADIDATQSEARVESDRASLLSSQTNLETQKNNLVKAERDYQRQQNLLKEDATTKQTALDAETALKAARNQIITSQAQIDQQKANMRIEEQNLKYTKIVAPIAGTVMSINVKQGQTINASQSAPTVLRIANLGTMTVQADVSEADVAKLYKGISVYFTTLSDANRRWPSVLKRIDPTPKTQNSVVLYNALFDIDNENNSLRPSSTAQVYFINAQANNVLKMPMAALQQGMQISRELAAKEAKDKKAKDAAKPAAAPAAPGAAPVSSNTTPGAARDGAAAPAPAAAAPATAANARPGAAAAGAGNAPANAQGNGPRARPGQQGGEASGPRAGGPGGFGGGGGFANMTPEQREEMMRRFQQRGAAGGGAGGGGFGNRNGQGAGAAGGGFGNRGQGAGGGGFGNRGGQQATVAGAAGAPRPARRRQGTVMVKKADGTLEARQVVIGVTDRVFGEVLSGLKEGEEVVVGKREEEAAAAAQPRNNNQNQNFNQQGNRPNNFNGGGNFRPF